MADFGFGHAPFGKGRFGHTDLNRDTLYNRTVPFRIKEDDEGDFEGTQDVYAQMFDYLLDKMRELPEQAWPIFAKSARESGQTLLIERQAISVSRNEVTLTVAESDRAKLLIMWASRTRSTNKDGLTDGWTALLQDQEQVVTAVNPKEGTLTVLTANRVNVPATIQVFPPELLALLGSNVGVFVDRLDPPEFTRRALQRHRLISDLKVSKDLFELLGRLYGFNIEAKGLFCIDQTRYDRLRASRPTEVFEIPGGSGNFYTTISPLGFFFDEIPMDVINLDSDEPQTVADVTITDVFGEINPDDLNDSQEGTNFYLARFAAGPEDFILTDGSFRRIPAHIQIRHKTTGETYTLEYYASGSQRVWFYAGQSPSLGDYELVYIPKRQCSANYKPAPAYRITILPAGVLNEPGASFERLVDRIEERVDTYIPIHIRTLVKVFQQGTTTQRLFGQSEITSTDEVRDTTSPLFLSGTLFDLTPMDEVPLDTGLFVITTTLVLTP